MVIHETTRLIAKNYERVWAGRARIVLTGIIIRAESNVSYRL